MKRSSSAIVPFALAAVAVTVGGCTSGTSGGAPPSPSNYEFDLHVYAYTGNAPAHGAPIEGARVALDTASGRRELVTDASGTAHVLVPNDTADLTLTAAKSGLVPAATIYKATIDELKAEIATAGELYVLLGPRPAAPPHTVNLTVRSTMPNFCASGAVYDSCTRSGIASQPVPLSTQPLTITAYSIDNNDCPIEMQEIRLPDATVDRSVDVEFDGTGNKSPSSTDITVRLPDAKDSVLRTQGLYTGSRFPLLVVDPTSSRIIGGACHEHNAEDGQSIDVHVAWFPPASGDPRFDLIFFPNYAGPHDGDVMEFAWRGLPGAPAPGSLYQALDPPRVTFASPTLAAAAPTLASTFMWQPIAGATRFDLVVVDSAQRDAPLWMARSFHNQAIKLPKLPSGVDTSGTWPAEGAASFRIQACEKTMAWPVPWPMPAGSNCSVSAAVDGRLTQ